MFTLFHFWIDSLRLLAPFQLFSLLKETVLRFTHICAMVIINFKWFLITDFLLFVFFGNKIIKILNIQDGSSLKAHPSTLFFYLVSGVIWFIISSALLLFMCKDDETDPLTYFKINFFRYIQLSLFFSFMLFMLLALVITCGISKFPTPHWTIICIMRLLELTTLFYWIDSTSSLKNVFTALEKSINFIIYNLPVFASILITMWLTEALARGLIFGWADAFNIDQALLGGKAEQALKGVHESFSITAFMLFKYSKFIIEFFWITFLFVVYRQKKETTYTKSFFE